MRGTGRTRVSAGHDRPPATDTPPAVTLGPGARVALIIVIASIPALALLPSLADLYTREFRRGIIAVVEPARSMITDVHLSLATGGAALGDFLETGDEQYVTRYNEATAAEFRAYERLRPLIPQLTSRAARQYEAAVAYSTAWHASVAELLAGVDPTTAAEARLERELYTDALVAVARLDREIVRSGEVRRSQVVAAERLQRRVSIAILIIALAALGAVVSIGRRLFFFADTAERRRRALATAAESRARLIRGFSHDLKNPLGAASGYAEVLEEGILGDLTDAQRQSLRRIRRSVDAAISLTDDLVDLARAEAGQLEIDRRTIDPAALVRQIVDEYRAQARAADLTLALEPLPELPPIRSDPRRIHQIIGNLLSNAIKYTPRAGRISIRGALRTPGPARRAGTWLAIDVTNTGPHIPAEKQDAIFHEFTRLEPVAGRGAGLGLTISRALAHALGGEISLDSRPGHHTTFTLWLPVPAPRVAPAPRAA